MDFLEKTKKKINSFEMWTYRKGRRIKRADKHILRHIGLRDRILLNVIKENKEEFIRKKSSIEMSCSTYLPTNGKILGKVGRWKKKTFYIYGNNSELRVM